MTGLQGLLDVLVSYIHGQAARAMFKAIISGKPMAIVLDLAGRLRASRSELFEALQPEELSATHLFVLTEIMAHIEEIEARMGRFDQALLQALQLGNPGPSSKHTAPAPNNCNNSSVLS